MQFLIQNTPVKLCLQTLSPKTLRLCVLPAGESVKEVFSTLDLAPGAWGEPDLVLSAAEEGQEVKLGDFSLSLSPRPLTIRVFKNASPLQTLALDPDTGDLSFPLGEGPLFGLGHGFPRQMDRRGGDYDLRTGGQIRGIQENYSAVSPTPYVISTQGWALYFHQPWRGDIDLRGEQGLWRRYPAPYCDVFVVACEEPLDAPREYYGFTGLPPMLPKYAFGYQQSYRTLVHDGENYVLKTARYLRDHEIPCDLLIYLGTGYCEYGWNTHNGNFQWHPDVFPHPEETMRQLHDLNYKVSLHITRCPHGLHGTVSDEAVSPLEYDHAKNYWRRHEELHAQAQNEAWWPDDADGVDMEQRLCRHRMYYEGSLQLAPDVRPLQMQRNTFPGANRWGGVIWSGDVLSEWETLKNQVPIGLNAALSASPYWGTDTGGFFCTPEFDGELLLRWVAYSAFTPFFRGHGRPSFLHNPWGWSMFQSLDQLPLELSPGMTHDGPPSEGSLPDRRVEPLFKKFIELRYSLLPYLYSLSHEACDGVPLMRPLWCYHPEDREAVQADHEYYLGENLLVAPVTAKGAEQWDVYLPAGTWYDFWTRERYEGGQTVTVPAPLDQIPLFVPAGGILPKAPVVQYVPKEKPLDFEPLTLEVYTGKDGCFQLYEDDGISLGYQRGEHTLTHIRWEEGKGLAITGESALFPGRSREIQVVLLPQGRKERVTVEYQAVPRR